MEDIKTPPLFLQWWSYLKMKTKPIKAYAIVKNNKIDVLNIYKDKDVVLNKGEKLVLVEIKVIYEKKT